MQLPFAGLLGLASGAMSFVQKVFSHQGPGAADFDAELTYAMAAVNDAGKTPLSRILSGEGPIDEQAFQEIIATPAGMLLFQFMTALREMGLQPSDIQILMNGGGAQISDEALQTLLTLQGMGREDIAALMADPALKAGMKTQIAASFTEALQSQANSGGIDLDALLALAAPDAETVDSIIERIISGKQLVKGQGAASGEAGLAGKLSAQQADVQIGLIQRNVPHIAAEIGNLVAETLGKTSFTGLNSSPQVPNVEKMIQIAGDTFGVSSEIMSDLFFAADEAVRKQAVEQVTAQVSAYLRSNAGQKLGAEPAEALAFLKSAMSEQEFAGIENSLKLWHAGQTLPDTKIVLNRETYEALAGRLGNRTPESFYEQHMRSVMDQLRQTLPSQMKNSEGSVTLRLHPPMLGRVDVSMTMHDGQLQAVFKTDQLITRDILVQNMHVLKEALSEQGIRATQFSVSTTLDNRSFHEGGFAFAQQGGHGRGSFRGGEGSDYHGAAYRDDEISLHTRPYVSEGGGLDLFA